MALSKKEKQRIKAEEEYRAMVKSELGSESEKHGFPALLSFFIPGLGQLIKGQAGKGILIFILVIVGLAMFVLPGILIWLWQVADAYNSPIGNKPKKKTTKQTKIVTAIVVVLLIVATYNFAKGLPQTGTNDTSTDVIGKYAYNKTNNTFRGRIVKQAPCSTNSKVDCYEIYRGPSYTENIEAPISNSTVKTTKPITPPDWYSYDDWDSWK